MSATTPGRRAELKAGRRQQLLRAGAVLVAERGLAGTRLEDLGAAVGISGPAVYRHFPGKEALVTELLLDVSRRLLAGGREVVAAAPGPRAALDGLLEFHLDFAFAEPQLIRIHDRDLPQLAADPSREIRSAQRGYAELWVDALLAVRPGLVEADARVAVHAAFGLLNSTPHSARRARPDRARAVLRSMAAAALAAPT